MVNKYKVITLCGSTRFMDIFHQVEHDLTLKGNIVLSVEVFEKMTGEELSEEQIELLNDIHRKKIDISDAILVIDMHGYIGDATKAEIEYAESLGKEVLYFSKIYTEIVIHNIWQNNSPHDVKFIFNPRPRRTQVVKVTKRLL